MLAVVSDRKLASVTGDDVDFYDVDVTSVTEYYPYGMRMNGRSESTSEYRYSFQGQEHDDEVKGEGNSVNYKYRMNDPRIGRWLSVDPKRDIQPWLSPYISMNDNPIIYKDADGDVVILAVIIGGHLLGLSIMLLRNMMIMMAGIILVQ